MRRTEITVKSATGAIALLEVMGFEVIKHYKMNGDTEYVAKRGDETVIIFLKKQK